MKVVFLAPAYPPEMQQYTRGLAEVGASVYGVGDAPVASLPRSLKQHLTDYLQVPRLLDEADVTERVYQWVRGRGVDRVLANWEVMVLTAARLRERLGVPGMSYDAVRGFRDKQLMKERVAAAGLRVPRAIRVRSAAEARAGAAQLGYPLVLKPIAGAGSADTFQVDSDADLERALAATQHVPECSLEEFIEGDEFTFDTVCGGGKILYWNISWYRPRPLVQRQLEWCTPQTIALRNPSQSDLAGGAAMGRAVIDALGFRDGFTHMEWFRNTKGEAVFGEIGARPPGARLVHLMNYACDIDLFRGWAEAVCWGKLSQDTTKKYNAGVIFKRAQGPGNIVRRYEGLDRLMARYGEWVKVVDLTPIGSPRRDWKSSAVGDGWIVVRHPDRDTALAIGDAFASELKIVTG